MPKPPAEFILHTHYKGKVQIRELVKSHGYRINDPENGREWEASPSATGLTDKMEKGAGLMVYAMSEAMKYMDRQFTNLSIKQMVEGEFTFQKLFKEGRQAHLSKSALGRRVGTASHKYVEELLNALVFSQKRHTQFIVPNAPMAIDIASDLKQSFLNIIENYNFDSVGTVDKYREVVNRDIEVRSLLWQEALMLQRTCQSAREFFIAAVKAGALKVWAVEQLVHSREFFFSGKFDCILEFAKPFEWRGYTIPKGVYLTDYKTSNPGTDYPMGIYPSHLAQIGLYDVAYCEEFPEVQNRITGHLILGSSKQGLGFHPYVSLKRGRNRKWGKSLVPVNEFMHQGEKELKGLNIYASK